MTNVPDLGGQTVVVTGASRGIGRSIAWHVAECGAFVIPCARSDDELASLAQEMEKVGGNVHPQKVDIADETSIQRLFKHVREVFGKLDVLINNAGIGIYGDTINFTAEDFDRVQNINVRGTFLCCREALRLMKPQEDGYIINISSVVGIKGYPRQAAYTASKHAVVGLTRSLAAEYQEHNIRVSVVLPGGVETDLVTSARPDLDTSELMQPEDVADTVLYLLALSDRAAVDQIYVRRKNSSSRL